MADRNADVFSCDKVPDLVDVDDEVTLEEGEKEEDLCTTTTTNNSLALSVAGCVDAYRPGEGIRLSDATTQSVTRCV